MNSIRYYNSHAAELFERYRALNFDVVHRCWIKYLPDKPGLACDIGAGSGRDAKWLADNGWEVIAVEPADELRAMAEAVSLPEVTWLDDSLPGLEKLRGLNHRFDLILLSAVWMHVAPAKRERAFRILSEMLKPEGVLVISLRHGRDKEENKQRGFHPVSAEELHDLARQRALALTDTCNEPDQNRDHVSWETLVFTMPDDGTGSLPLLRHIIVNDEKSSTYKLGLLRILTRIAEGNPGAVINRTDDEVEIPLGLLGLYWIKQYKTFLLRHRPVPQQPNISQGYGFAREDFYKLESISGNDLRIGNSFAVDRASVIIGAIRDACNNIVNMPVKHTTYPGMKKQVFEKEKNATPRARNQPIILDMDFLQTFGTLRVPATIWDTMSHYACWLEPTIIREWKNLIEGWQGVAESSLDLSLFNWEEPVRETSLVRNRLDSLNEKGPRVPCVWSARHPRHSHIDQCFPWARWQNNDLWNLLPTAASVNISKGDKLPSALAMMDAKSRIKEWWQRAYLESDLQARFMVEAGSSLPGLIGSTPELDEIYRAMQFQRTRLKTDQQLVEWSFKNI